MVRFCLKKQLNFLWGCLLIVAAPSCQENSNELVPISRESTFEKIFSFNGNAIGKAIFSQEIQPGLDSLKLKIQNIKNEDLPKATFLFWVQDPVNQDDPFKWAVEISQDTIAKSGTGNPITLFSHPELPLNSSLVQFIPLSIQGQSNDSITGLFLRAKVYSKISSVFENPDPIQGYINADGEIYFQYQKGENSRKLTGQLVQSLSLINGNLQDGDKNYNLTLVKESSTVAENSIELVFDVTPLQDGMETQLKLFIQK